MKKHKENIDKKENIASKIRFEEKLKGFIEIVDERINRLIAKGLDVCDEVRGKYDSQLEKLLEQRKELDLKKESISELSEIKWREIKDSIHQDFECLIDEVEVTYESIMVKVKHMKKNQMDLENRPT